MKSLLNLKGAKVLSKNEQKKIVSGGWLDTYCAIGQSPVSPSLAGLINWTCEPYRSNENH